MPTQLLYTFTNTHTLTSTTEPLIGSIIANIIHEELEFYKV